jgi:DNA invertase Pin-like site-specific DNA recombinase
MTQRQPTPGVYVYCRVSTGEQARSGASLDLQERKCRDYAALHDLEVVEVIRDDGCSAKSLRRPGMDRMREGLRAQQASGVVIWKLDRLSRSVVDYGSLIEELESRGVALMSVCDNLDTASASGRLIVNVMIAVSQWEREAGGERTCDALAEIREQGYHVGRLPVGYDRVGHPGKGCLLRPNGDYPLVEQVRVLRESGRSLASIAKFMESGGTHTPGGSIRWYPQTVRRVLSSPWLGALIPEGDEGGYKYRTL